MQFFSRNLDAVVDVLNPLIAFLFVQDSPPPPVDITIDSCIRKWNSSSYDYDITVTWIVNGTWSVIHQLEFITIEEDHEGIIKESDIRTIQRIVS